MATRKTTKPAAKPAAKPAPATANATTPILVLVQGAVAPNFRPGSARYAYWQVVQGLATAGHTYTQAVAYLEKHAPVVPRNGRFAGKAEPGAGWLSYFRGSKGCPALIKVRHVPQAEAAAIPAPATPAWPLGGYYNATA